MGGVEVFLNGQAFFEVRDDWRFDDFARWLGHQTAHPGQLLHLVLRTTRTGVRHHVNGVHFQGYAVATWAKLRNFFHHRVCNAVRTFRPSVNDLVVLLALGDQTVRILLLIFFNAGPGCFDHGFLFRWYNHVGHTEGDAGLTSFLEAQLHHPVCKDHRRLLAAEAVDLVDDVGDFLLGHQLIDDCWRHLWVTWQQICNHETARGGVDRLGDGLAIIIDADIARLDLGMQRHNARIQSRFDFTQVAEGLAFADFVFTLNRQEVETQDDVLAWHDDRLAACRAQDVVGRHHQHAGFKLGFNRQWHVNGHLVAVEVGIECGADQRVQLDGLTFDQLRFEGLDAQAVQRRCAVQHHGMLADHFVENVPNFRTLFFNELLGLLHRAGQALGVQALVDEGLEQFQSHLLRQTALMQLQFWTNGDHRAARIIDALAEQVLTETTLLTLQHVSQGLQRTLVRAGDDATATAVVEQSVDGFLQHALFVAHDDIWRTQFNQALQPVVAVDHAAIEVVQV